MFEPGPFDAVPPAYGVAARALAGTVELRLNDAGGRGRPVAVVLLPVAHVGERLHALVGGAATPPPYTAQQVRAIAHRIDRTEGHNTAPFEFVSSRADWLQQGHTERWPFEHAFVLALLLYPAAAGDRSDARPESAAAASAGIAPDGWSAVADAVNHCLQHHLIHSLRGGLVTVGRPAAAGRDADAPVTFTLASCHYPSDIFDRMPDDALVTGPADASMLALARLLEAQDAPTLLVFAGDQVYVDPTAGAFDPKIADAKYRLPYERRGESRGVQEALQRLDTTLMMVADDHEINDNWDRDEPDGQEMLALGVAAFRTYQRFGAGPGLLWHETTHRGLPFFAGDTRTQRDGRTTGNHGSRRIMCPNQFKALRDWLTRAEHASLPKFVVTPSALLPRRLAVARDPLCAVHSDAWDGYPASLHDLLSFACDHEVKGLVFLSGDEHVSSLVRADVTHIASGRRCTLHSVHSSALYAPYPFANSIPEDFAGNEVFLFPDACAGPYRCSVQATFVPGDGFAVLRVETASSRPTLDVTFHRPSARDARDATVHLLAPLGR